MAAVQRDAARVAVHLTVLSVGSRFDHVQCAPNKNGAARLLLLEPSTEQVDQARTRACRPPERERKQRVLIDVPCPAPWRALRIREWVTRNCLCMFRQTKGRDRARERRWRHRDEGTGISFWLHRPLLCRRSYIHPRRIVPHDGDPLRDDDVGTSKF
jgi:hypothetical protein